MILTIFLTLFLLLIIYLLFIPVILFIDTTTNEYYIQLKGLAKASIELHSEEVLIFKLRISFFNFYFYPLRKWRSSKSKKKKIVTKKEFKNIKKLGFRKTLRVLRSFKIKNFVIDIDTGDWTLNAKLYPISSLLNNKVGSFNINFEGRNRMALHIQNRPISIIKSFF